MLPQGRPVFETGWSCPTLWVGPPALGGHSLSGLFRQGGSGHLYLGCPVRADQGHCGGLPGGPCGLPAPPQPGLQVCGVCPQGIPEGWGACPSAGGKGRGSSLCPGRGSRSQGLALPPPPSTILGPLSPSSPHHHTHTFARPLHFLSPSFSSPPSVPSIFLGLDCCFWPTHCS